MRCGRWLGYSRAVQRPVALLAVVFTLACPKKHEEARPSPEAKPSAAKEIEYPIEALTCRDGVLGKITAPTASVSASASVSATAAPVPIASASAVPSALAGSGSYGSIGALSSAFGDPSVLAPIGDGGTGWGSGIGLGTVGGYGGGLHGGGFPSRTQTFPIVAMPVDARGPRALAVAKGVCEATEAIRGCHSSNDRPVGAAVFDLAIDGTGAKVTNAKKETDTIKDPLLTCVSGALAAAKYDLAAAGTTTFRVAFEKPVLPPRTKMIESGVTIAGPLPPEVVKRIIRANFPRIRACYEAGLRRDPALTGKVTIDFVIDSTGAMNKVAIGESTLPDEAAKTCIAGVFRTLSFPEPEGGIVKVKYPITLSRE
jgi:hypothetical protein